ncbi:snRNA-activating protein complex subunit 3 isoform X1 [Panulirus ornatus]|uniref:snRNA-activating protein complex subunit 3 isoform X1 n=2 Tax=Panulirus ornatus TaxID=150431 RepID=UPI003A8C3577
MENIHNLKRCPWITEEPMKLRDYFDKYHKVVDEASGQPHEEKVCRETAIRNFFPPVCKEEDGHGSDPFSVEKLESDCSISMLTVDDELVMQDVSNGPVRHSGRLTNWYAGSFQDGIIPEGAAHKLMTLEEQAHELHLRETVRDYARLRYRLLKYFSTVRMVIGEDNSPEPTRYEKDDYNECIRDIVLNVRVQRPYHKKTHMKKACNRFPTHSQELLLLGSQKLTELRDALICINDLAVNQDISADPQLYQMSHLPNNSMEFPSGFFYINGVFYNDDRHPQAKIYSEGIVKWAQRHSEIGELKSKSMHETTFLDLELRLGYPYVFLHQGNCEHIIIFTDVRLHHQDDVQDPARYPLLRGQASKLSVKCCICSLHLANWIVKDEPRLPIPNAHVCDRCLKSFCYNSRGVKIHNIRVYPFIDEFMTQQKKSVESSKYTLNRQEKES